MNVAANQPDRILCECPPPLPPAMAERMAQPVSLLVFGACVVLMAVPLVAYFAVERTDDPRPQRWLTLPVVGATVSVAWLMVLAVQS